jgi:site-specific recombinase XerD
MKQRNENSNLKKIRDELERRLIVLRYSKAAAGNYKMIFGWVEDYLNEYGETEYTKELGQEFLSEYPLQSKHSQSQFKKARTLIRRIDEILENKLFTPCFRKAKMECPVRFNEILDKYVENLTKLGYKKPTIKSKRMYVGRFLGRLPETVSSLNELSAADLYEVFTKYEWPSVGLIAAKNILAFLFENKITKMNMSICVPKPNRPKALPSVYSSDEIKRLLSSVDRTTSLGKRDYAVLVFAAYIGLRSSDIVNLSFKDIDYSSKTISIIQVKTARPLTLVMNNDVEEAIADYIKNGRPQSQNDKIFLGFKAPFFPLAPAAGYAIARKYFNLAGIAARGRNRGTHALRASYATALVAKGIPYAVVQEALGHEDPESAKYYVRIDVKRLRMCALDVPKPTGALAVMLDDMEGVL